LGKQITLWEICVAKLLTERHEMHRKERIDQSQIRKTKMPQKKMTTCDKIKIFVACEIDDSFVRNVRSAKQQYIDISCIVM